MAEWGAIVLAAGQGKRMHSPVAKQFLLLDGRPVLYYSLKAFEESGAKRIILVTGENEIEYCRREIVEKYGFRKVLDIVAGGAERYHSVRNGLRVFSRYFSPEDLVLIHDGARPLVEAGIISRAEEAAGRYGACTAAMPVKDTIKEADGEQFAKKTLDRSRLWQIQTPQAFSCGLICRAYEELFADPGRQAGVTDDAMVVEAMTGARVRLVEGSYENLKVTTPEDLVIAECLLKRRRLESRKDH